MYIQSRYSRSVMEYVIFHAHVATKSDFGRYTDRCQRRDVRCTGERRRITPRRTDTADELYRQHGR